eukprot:1648801-Rhodomonas_salina.1
MSLSSIIVAEHQDHRTALLSSIAATTVAAECRHVIIERRASASQTSVIVDRNRYRASLPSVIAEQ